MTNLMEMSSSSPVLPNRPSSLTHSASAPAPSPLHQDSFKSPFFSAAQMMTPLASPMKRALSSVQMCLEEVGHLTRLDLQDSWLPITESRNGNAYYAAFHTLSSGIGFQALVLPLAFTALGWAWGIISLSVTFVWQLYTMWLLVQLHESSPGIRYSRYLGLSKAAFGERLGKILALFPTLYLAGGTCVSLIMMGSTTLKIFFHTVCRTTCNANSLSLIEWYIVFVCLAVLLSQLPNLNSIAGVSLIGAITAVSYCTLTWILSVSKSRPLGVSYEPVRMISQVGNVCSVLNGLGIIAFAFRGHNVVLEIQGTMPSSAKNPSSVPMWKGVKFAYLIIAACLFPMAIGGYWAYGNLIPANNGMMSALDKYHGSEISKAIMGMTSLLIVIHSLTSFQIYAMPVFDNMEFKYTSNKNRPCPWWVRAGIRVFFGCLAFFISIALPFLKSLAGLIGGIALPVSLAYPCLMWIKIKKPEKNSFMWWLNWILGSLGMILSALLVFGAIWTIATQGIAIHFFKPE
ncbi:lysine histidine transporter-like 8 [Andrographis paniculata]|uniref:lysine histidine transporter-like 8 n=1 Tax=Andrographis paniculata TaxID=175694 RepID=UPI0021E88C60|nr:lysine histidine transporter-like 8 [Andrographis paniculata]